MPGSPRISAEAFAIERLRENPNLDFATLRAAAAEVDVSLQPIQYGRARRHLGLTAPAEAAAVRVVPAVPAGEPRAPAAAGGAGPGSAPAGSAPAGSVPGGSVPAGSVPGGSVPAIRAEALAAKQRRPAIDPGTAATPILAAPRPMGTRSDSGEGHPTRPAKKGSAAFEFLLEQLRADGTLAYGELKARATTHGFPIAPIMYGRAKALLGLVPVKPRRKNTAAAPAAATAVTAPRSLKQVESVAADRFNKQLADVRSLEHLVATVKELDADRRRLRNLLERIVTMIDETLG